jgi:hypothetical protein
LADERSPIDGGDASDFEAAAKAVKAKAQKTRKAVDAATRETRVASDQLNVTERKVTNLINEQKRLEAKRRQIEKRLRSAELRYEANELQTPANAARTEATIERHKKDLARVEKQLSAVDTRQQQQQVAAEGPNVRKRIGSRTPTQEAARARRLEREAKVARQQRVGALREAGAGQYETAIGPQPLQPGEVQKTARELSRARTGLIDEAKGVAEQLREANKVLNQAEGRLKAARTRLRKLETSDPAFTGSIRDPEGYARKVTGARASIERAQAPVAAAKAERDALAAQMPVIAARQRANRDELRAARELQAARAKTRDERPAEGDLAELERVAQQNNARMAAALDPAGRRKLAAAQAPIIDPAEQARAARELEAAKRAERPFTPLQPRGAGGRDVDRAERVRGLEAEAERRVQKEVERRETDKVIRAEAAERVAIEKRAAAELQAAAAAQETARAAAALPGTGLIPHPTQFGQRVPGPFGQVYERPAIPFPSDKPLRRTAEQPRRDVYARRPATARSSIGETQQEIAGYRAAAVEQAKQAREAQAASAVSQRATEQRIELLNRAQQGESTMTARLNESGEALRRWQAQLGVVDQGMRRHGTLTTEFITAAAKGEVAYQEWGWQIGAAAAKFGAWTAAGAGIYGVIGAVSQVGQGAIQSASGVESLKRSLTDVNSGQAQQSFREQAAHYNVDIETVVDAQTRMAAVFHNQADAATAAGASLIALKTGQVDVQQSTKDLIAIQQAYGSSAKDLVNLFDELNYVQNNYGARIPDLETGIAAAAGSFKQMGGSIEDIVALFTTLQRHGTTGNITSTIVRRMPNELAKPENQATLRQYGIDPGAQFAELIKQAQQAVARGADPRVIAKAMVGGQWAGRFLNVLTDQALYSKVGGELRGGRARGASETELAHVKAEATEVLKSIGIQLQNLGSNLATSGLATVFGSMAIALRDVLAIVNTLLGVFNQLPGPLKTAAAYLLTANAAMAAGRRLSIGGALQGRFGGAGDRVAPYLLETDERRTRRLVGKGVRGGVKAAADEVERATIASVKAQATADQLARAEATIRRDAARRVAAGVIDEAEAAATVVAAEERTALAAVKARDAAIIATEARAQAEAQYLQQARYDELMANTSRKQRNAAAKQFAIQEGIYVRPLPGTVQPGYEAVHRLDEARGASTGGVILPAGYRPPRGSVPPPSAGAAGTAVAAGAVATAAQADQAKRMLPQLRDQATKYRQLAAAENVGVAAKTAATDAAVAARGAIGAAAGSLRAMAVGLLEMMGPIGWLTAAVLFLPAIANRIGEAYQKMKKGLDQASSGNYGALPTNKGELDTYIKRVQGNQPDLGVGGRLSMALKKVAQDLFHPWQIVTQPYQFFQNPIKQAEAAQQRQQATIEAARKRAASVASADKAGRVVGGLSGAQIVQRAEGDIAALQAGSISVAEANRRIKLRMEELKHAILGKGEDPKKIADELQQALDQANAVIEATIQSRFDLLRSLTDDPIETARLNLQQATQEANQAKSPTDKNEAQAKINEANKALQQAIKDDADKRLAALGALVQGGAASSGQLQSYISQQAGLVAQLRGSSDPEDMQRYTAARQSLLDALQNAGKSELDAALANASTPGQINKAYRNYERAFRKASSAAQGAVQEQQPTQRFPIGGGLGMGGIMGLGGGATRPGASVDKKLAAQLKAIRRQREQEVFEARSALADAQTQVAAGGAEAGLPRIQIQLAAIGRKVVGAIRAYGRGSKQALDLVAQQQQLQAEAVQEQAGLIQAQTGYAAAGATTPGGEATANLGGLQRLLSFQGAHPEVYKQADLLGTMTQIRELRKQQAEQVRQDAEDLINAHYALLESYSDDPVRNARLEAQKAQAILNRGGFKNRADRMQAMANRNVTRRAAQDAAVQAKMEDIAFDVDIGKKTIDQEIAAYERLLHTSKMGQQQKKRLKQEIARLKHESETADDSEYELGLENIRIPSVYEVGRMVKGGVAGVTRATPAGVTNANTIYITVNGRQDYEQLGRVLEKHIKGAGKATARAAQMR